MKIVVFGLSLSSSWGNGHATTFRALLGVLGKRHEILFLERDRPWYAAHRDLAEPEFCRLAFYRDFSELSPFRPEIEAADVVVIGSFVPEGAALIGQLRPWVRGLFCFYDIDTPATLASMAKGGADYLAPACIPIFDLYFSFTGGPTLVRLEDEFGARRAAALYCSADTDFYRPLRVPRCWDLGYLGTYSPDRQPGLEALLLAPARRLPERRFVVAGALYPPDIDWPANVARIAHLPPAAHPAFYAAQSWTLNLTRADMAAAGYSPSVRLFEASACGTPILSDAWPGLEGFFAPESEIMIAAGTEAVLDALSWPETKRARLAASARRRCLECHSAMRRAAEWEALISACLAERAAGRAKPDGVRA
ncbi:MAG TPA: glycosyltransferase [Acidocella sp.]|nr:glycosyltransferase [Acidocella sp.]